MLIIITLPGRGYPEALLDVTRTRCNRELRLDRAVVMADLKPGIRATERG
jgi:hypothetical protein